MKINSLTSLRFIAAFGVFLHHFDFYESTNNYSLKLIYNIFFEGFIGVTFFYVLSGFIISFSYYNRIADGVYSSREFLVNRFARLYPVHLLTFFITAFAYIGYNNFGHINPKVAISNLLLIHSLIPGSDYYFSFNGVSWSISAEFVFYIIFIDFLAGLRLRLIAILSSVLLLTICFLLAGPLINNQLNGWTFYINPFFRIIDFMAGMLLFRIFAKKVFNPTSVQCNIMEVSSIFCLIVFIFLGIKFIPLQWRWDLFYLPPMVFIVWAFSHEKGFLSKALSNPVLVLLGDASFSLYMTHQIIINTSLMNTNVDINSFRSVIWFIFMTLLTGVFVSVFVYKVYEKPLNKFIKGLYHYTITR